MSDPFPFNPQPPEWRVDWESLDARFEWIRNLKGCAQDPVRHAEGDVWIHVRMVCEAMTRLESWRLLPEPDRAVLFWSALLHDVAKPACFRTDPDGKISTRGHSWRGAIMSRRILWRLDVPFPAREAVAALVRHHLVPLYLVEREDPRRLAAEVSQSVRCDWLAILSEADARGRTCPDPQRLLDHIALFRATCEEYGCLDRPFEFASDQARYLYFHDLSRQPDSPAHEEFSCQVVLMSGLPGAGKDHWIERQLSGWPIIALDEIRKELGIVPSESQGRVLAEARERAKVFLRQKQSFVWNATNLSRQIRSECVRLFTDYGAHVRIVYRETTPDRLFAQNRQRRQRVPVSVIERMLDRWEVPDRTEAHQVDWIIDS